MRRLLLISIMLMVSMPAISFAFAQEEWKEFRSNAGQQCRSIPDVRDTIHAQQQALHHGGDGAWKLSASGLVYGLYRSAGGR